LRCAEIWRRIPERLGNRHVSEHTLVYSIHIIDNGCVTLGVLCDDCEDEAQALNWAYYYLGRYRCDAVQLFRRLDTYGNPIDLVTEIKPPDRNAEGDQQSTAREYVD
jgi:hypothetical protein